jgi:thymidine phosphorylase
MTALILKVLRYAVAAAGGGVVMTSDDTLTQAAGAIATLGSVAVSIYTDVLAARAATQKNVTIPPAA